MVPTFKNTECGRCAIVKQLNRKLASIRYSIENAFGICKGRFRLLNRPLECAREDITRAIRLITAIFTLHNFLIDENDDCVIEVETIQETDIDSEDIDEDEEVYPNDEDEEVYPNDEAEEVMIATREILLRHMRWKRG
jgi:hypothetical protein